MPTVKPPSLKKMIKKEHFFTLLTTASTSYPSSLYHLAISMTLSGELQSKGERRILSWPILQQNLSLENIYIALDLYKYQIQTFTK